MTEERDSDPVWQSAWLWVQRQHDHEQFDDAALAALVAWLKQDPAHRAAYNKASQLWLLSGLIPPRNTLDDDSDPSAQPDDEARKQDAG